MIRMLSTFSIFLSIVCSVPYSASASPQNYGDTATNLQLMKSADWQDRRAAFYSLLQLGLEGDPRGKTYMFPSALKKLFSLEPERRGEIESSLIALLERENALVLAYAETKRTMPEDLSDYYGDVIGAVAALKSPASIDSLLGAVSTGGMATRALASLGSAAVQPLISKLSDPDPGVRSGAATALSQMMEETNRQNVDAASRLKIEQALLRVTSDSDVGVRLSAVDGLANFREKGVIVVLERLAASDPTCFPGQADQGKDLCPVRNAAQRALLKANSSPQTEQEQ
jgi:HEAT repeat protein